MIKKYLTYIKEQLDNHLDLDPFGEEDWDEDKPKSILQILRCPIHPLHIYCNILKIMTFSAITRYKSIYAHPYKELATAQFLVGMKVYFMVICLLYLIPTLIYQDLEI